MNYPVETLSYMWFVNYFIALAIVVVPFAFWYLIFEVACRILKKEGFHERKRRKTYKASIYLNALESHQT